MSEMKPQFLKLECETIEDLEQWGKDLAWWQRFVNWGIGDLARYAEARFPDTWNQVFPEYISPGLVDRCKAVAKAYPREEDRNLLATHSIHKDHKNDPQRIAKVQAHVDKGHTTDEAREAKKRDKPMEAQHRLLAVDVNYFLHRFWFSGAGVEAADGVASWVNRTSKRLKEDRGFTDVVCCFDAPTNDRKELTAEWEVKYKDRPPKDPELSNQLRVVRSLLESYGFCCVSIDGKEADDVMASYANQFDGQVTLLTQDKDLKQCLSSTCNMLLDVEWEEDPTSGEMKPNYKWLTAKKHFEDTGIRPDQWVEYQILAGDSADNIKGVPGVGEKGGSDLIKQYETADAVIEAAKSGDESMKEKRREALVEFESKLETTRQLVTLHTDLHVPGNTRI